MSKTEAETKKSQHDLDNEALDRAMTERDRAYWEEAGRIEKSRG